MTRFLKLHLLHAESSGLVESNILAAAIVSIKFVLSPSLGVASEIKQFFMKNKNRICSVTGKPPTMGENGVGFSNFEMTKNDVYNKKVLENPGFVKVFSSPFIKSLDLQDLDLP